MLKQLFTAFTFIILLGAGCTNSTTNNAGNQALQIEAITAANDTNDNNINDIAVSQTDDMIETTPAPKAELANDTAATEAVSIKSFTITGDNFTFSPASMTVNKGDTVRVTFKNMQGFHDFVIDEFMVATKQISAETEEVVEFVADQAGSFEYYCSVGSHRAMGMKGTLIVAE